MEFFFRERCGQERTSFLFMQLHVVHSSSSMLAMSQNTEKICDELDPMLPRFFMQLSWP